MSIQLTADTDGYYASASVYSVWVIARSGSITSPSTNAFTSTGRVLMTVEGLIASPATAINLFSYAESVPDAPSFITVTETGLVAAMGAYSDGIGFYYAGSELRNAGTVTGNIGVRFGDGQDALVSNDGYIFWGPPTGSSIRPASG